MFVLIVVPVAFGYLVTARWLRESRRSLQWALSYALGLLGFLAGVNLFVHLLPLRHAVLATLAALALLSAALLKLTAPPRPIAEPAAPLARLVLTVLALTAFFHALFWQMKWSDDDFFIHGPLMALYLRGVFPPRNPFFPDLPLFGHYGRDLAISALSTLVGERFFEVQYLLVAIGQAALVPIMYFTARRYLRNGTHALLATCFAFVGVNNAGRSGLLDTFQNNNTFAYLYLFVSVYLFLTAITRRVVGLTVLTGVAFGTYALIYETHFATAAIAFAAFPVVLCALRRRWRARYFAITAAVLLIAGLLACVQGGAMTDVARRLVLKTKSEISRSDDERRMTQEIRIQFPKPGLRITSLFGDEYPLWSPRVVSDAGLFAAVLPLTLVVVVARRRPFGILIATLTTMALLIPATIDFGAFNSESLRFLMLAGVGAAMLFAIVLGMLRDWVLAQGVIGWRALAVGLTVVLVVSFRPSANNTLQLLWLVAKYPESCFFFAEDWACSGARERPCSPVDVRASIELRGIARPGERILAHVDADDPKAALLIRSVLATFSRVFVTGTGLRVIPSEAFSMARSDIEPTGFRARTFWKTLNTDLLDDMKVDYLYLDPDSLPSDLYQRVREARRLERVIRQEAPGGGAVREVYRVSPRAKSPAASAPGDVRLVEVGWPAAIAARSVYQVRMTVAAPEGPPGTLRISYRVNFVGGPQVNRGDQVRESVALRPAGAGLWTTTFAFATPYDRGDYEVRLSGWDDHDERPLKLASGDPAVFTVSVR